jgi:hypothetical protein
MRKNACPSVWNGEDREEDTQQARIIMVVTEK